MHDDIAELKSMYDSEKTLNEELLGSCTCMAAYIGFPHVRFPAQLRNAKKLKRKFSEVEMLRLAFTLVRPFCGCNPVDMASNCALIRGSGKSCQAHRV